MPMLLAALLLLASPPEGRPRLPPVDTCAVAPGFTAFREELLRVIADKDVDRLLELSDENIMLSFGGDGGHADMRRMWELDRPAESRIWEELGEALSLGCAFGEGVAVAPSMAEALPIGVDAFDAAIVVKPATLRAGPNPKARAIATLDWDVVSVDEGIDEDGGWTSVKLKDGRTGFVRSDALRSPLDYRALFNRVDGRWRMTVFVAGD